jgi:hypothetical protein
MRKAPGVSPVKREEKGVKHTKPWSAMTKKEWIAASPRL